MSRVGKYPVIVPEGVNVAIEGNLVKASGKLGELSRNATKMPLFLYVRTMDGKAT